MFVDGVDFGEGGLDEGLEVIADGALAAGVNDEARGFVGGGVGYGGAVFVAPRFISGVSLSISDCVFLRCQVVATSNSYDFSDFINASQAVFLQGGAFAAFLPIVNKSRTDDPGYLLSITSSSFSQCLVLFSSNRLSKVGYDVVCGGAISALDDLPTRESVPNRFLLPLSRVVLQDLTFSGAPKCLHLGSRFGVARAVFYRFCLSSALILLQVTSPAVNRRLP